MSGPRRLRVIDFLRYSEPSTARTQPSLSSWLVTHFRLGKAKTRGMHFASRGTAMMRFVAIFLAVWASSSTVASANQPVDLMLVLAVDMSSSMSFEEQKVQRAGYAAALRSPALMQAIRAGPLGRIAVAYVQWGDFPTNPIPWFVVDSPESAEVLASRVARTPIDLRLRTSISRALNFSLYLLRTSRFVSERQVIDISGDGPNNEGPPVIASRDDVIARGITINGLPVMLQDRVAGGSEYLFIDIDRYYQDCVVGGPGAFTLTITRLDDMAATIEKKLVAEVLIAAPMPAMAPLVAISDIRDSRARIDCSSNR